MRKSILAVAVLVASLSTAHAANNPEDWRVSYQSVMDHYNGGRYSQALAELPRLGLSGAQIDVVWNAIKSGQTWGNSTDFDKWLGGNGNGNGQNGNGNGNFVSSADFQKDQQRQDAALTAERDRAWKEEQKQWSEIQTKYTEAAGKALEGEVRNNKADQAKRDAAQDEHINAVQGAAQTANDRATHLEARTDMTEDAIVILSEMQGETDARSKNNATRLDGAEGAIRGVQGAAQTANDRATALEGRADATEGAIRETNAQLQVTDKRSQNNAVRLDGVESVNARQDETLSSHDSRITAAQATADTGIKIGKANSARLDNHETRISANTSEITKTQTVVKAQGEVLQNHEGRITTNEQNISSLNQSFNDYQAYNANAIQQGNARTLKAANDYTDQRFNEAKKEARAGVAGAMAMSQIPQVGRYGKFSLGAGAGTYVNQQAIAVGFSARLGERVITKAAVSADSASNFGAAVGVGVEW